MQNTLCATKKLGFIDGTLTKPSNEPTKIEDCWMVSSMLVAWIFNTVNNAFLHGNLHEEVYIRLPLENSACDQSKVGKSHKSVYCLHQAPHCWFTKVPVALKTYGFVLSYSYYSLFTYCQKNVHLNISVYVDDLIIVGNSSRDVSELNIDLGQYFHMKDLGVLKYFLGLEVSRGASGFIYVSSKYALNIIARLVCSVGNQWLSIEQNHHLDVSTSPLMTNSERYRLLVGCLIYLTITCPELSYCMHVLAQFMQ